MKAVAIIQARVGSSRLPGKVLLKLAGKTALEHVIQRALKANTIKEVIVATTVKKDDLKIVKLISKIGVGLYCGSEEDVLDRYYQAARLFNLKHIVRITSDCPVIDPKVIDKVVRLYFKTGADYCSNILSETFPDGQDVEVFSFSALELAFKGARWLSEREHPTNYIMRTHKHRFKLASCENRRRLINNRWTLDRNEDYLFLKVLFNNLYNRNHFFGMKEILQFLKLHPEARKINSKILRNEGYLKSLKYDRKIK